MPIRSYLRAFFFTTCAVGVVNAAFLVYYLNLPFVEGKGGLHRNPSERIVVPILIVNWPALPLWELANGPPDEPKISENLAVSQCMAYGAIFWGLIAVVVDVFWMKRTKNRPAKSGRLD